jgi:hypothetical protein
MEPAVSIFRIKDCTAYQIAVVNAGTLRTRYV